MVSLGIGVDVLGGIPEAPEDKDTNRKISKPEFIYICGSKMVPAAAQ